jgi:hypothetical protein
MNWSLISSLAMLSVLTLGGCTKAKDDTDMSDTDTSTDTDTTADEDCTNGVDDDNDQDVDCDDRDCRNDDACQAPEYFDPSYVAIYADFGWDADNSKVVTVTGQDADGNPVTLMPDVLIVLLSEDQTEYCSAQYVSVATELDGQNWTGPNDFGSGAKTDIDHTGFILDTIAESSTFQTDCDNLDPDVWGDIETTLGAFTFGGGVGNPHADVEANFDAIATGNKIDPAIMAGGGFFVGPTGGAAADGDYIAASWSLGFALDETFTTVSDDAGAPVFLQGSDIVNETGVPPTAYYRVFPAYVFGVDFLLPQ